MVAGPCLPETGVRMYCHRFLCGEAEAGRPGWHRCHRSERPQPGAISAPGSMTRNNGPADIMEPLLATPSIGRTNGENRTDGTPSVVSSAGSQETPQVINRPPQTGCPPMYQQASDTGSCLLVSIVPSVTGKARLNGYYPPE